MANHPSTSGRRESAPPALLQSTVTRIGYYSDTLPKLIITIGKKGLEPLSISPGVRHPVTLYINGDEYHAALRTTLRSPTVMICPDLIGQSGETIRLVEVLAEQGLSARDRVQAVAEMNGETISLVISGIHSRRDILLCSAQ